MIRSVCLLAAVAALIASPVCAAEAAAPAPREAAHNAAQAEVDQTDPVQTGVSQTGPASTTMREQCSRENPFIEYRDCVNASTRDPNAKVRMG